ncbi:MAG TPA: CoA-transferase, partial [Desulfosarcina sp.]|nr:CoA-transferase [Desulfosarcina sp.]
MTGVIPEEEIKSRIARRIAREFMAQDRPLVINLGVGIPTQVASFLKSDRIFIQAENGLLGVGPLATADSIDRQLINAGRQPVTETPGCCYFDSATSFGMIRGGHIDATVIGAFEVDQTGNIANWIMPGGKQLGVGGAMDLVSGVRQVVVASQPTARGGKPKLVRECRLPVTGYHEADLVVTELALFRF